MRPRGLTGRILLAFAGLALAMLMAVSASLFLVLREMHQDATEASLRNQVTLIEAALARRAGGGQPEQTVRDLPAAIADDGGFVLLQRKNWGHRGHRRHALVDGGTARADRHRPLCHRHPAHVGRQGLRLHRTGRRANGRPQARVRRAGSIRRRSPGRPGASPDHRGADPVAGRRTDRLAAVAVA